MRQPFSLEQQVADQISTSGDLRKDRYISDMKQTGTKTMQDLVKKMQKKAQKGAGLFKGKFGKFLKTGINIGSSFLGPWGKVAKLAINAVDALKRQKDLKKMQKAIKSMGGVPAQFKGTFLENYLKGGAESSKAQLGEMLKGRKKAALTSDLISLAGDAVAVGKVAPELSSSLQKAGAKATDVAQNIKDKTMQQLKKGEMGYFPQDSDSDKILNRLFAKAEKGITDYGGPGDVSAEAIQGGAETLTPAISRDVIGGQTFEASDFSQKIAALADKAGGKSIPFMGGATIDSLNNPLMGLGGDSPLGQALFTPSTYTPLAQDLYMNYLTQPAGEPVITEAQGPSRTYY